MKLEQIRATLEEKSAALRDALNGDSVDVITGLTSEVNELKSQVSALEAAAEASRPVEVLSVKDASNDLDYKAMIDCLRTGGKGSFELKAAATTTSGAPGPKTRTGIRFGASLNAPLAWDKLRVENLTSAQASYLLASMSTGADTHAEGTAPTETNYAYTDNSFNARPITAFRQISELAMDSMQPGDLQFIIDDLMSSVYAKAIAQFIAGNGTSPQWNGLTGLSGIGTAAGTGVPRWKSLVSAIASASVTNGGAADIVLLNQADWAGLMTDTSLDGDGVPIYNPATGTASIHGCELVMDPNVPANTVYVGVRSQMILALVGAPKVLIGYSGTGMEGAYQTVAVRVHGNTIVRPASVFKITAFGAVTPP